MLKEEGSDFNKYVYPASVTIDKLEPSDLKAPNDDYGKEFKGSANKAEEVGFEKVAQDDSSMAVVLLKTVFSSFFYSFELWVRG